jgi:hypothetical protein
MYGPSALCASQKSSGRGRSSSSASFTARPKYHLSVAVPVPRMDGRPAEAGSSMLPGRDAAGRQEPGIVAVPSTGR